MRQDCYELLVLQNDNTPFQEHQLEGKCFVRAVAGKEYKVKFTIHREETGTYPFAHAICALSVDGTEIYGSLLNLNSSFETRNVFFHGFRVDSETIQVFTFNDIAVYAHPSPVDTNSRAGILQVAVYEAECTEETVNPKRNWNSAPTAVDRVSEDKKFWQQPSLATARGRDVKSSFNPVNFRRVRQHAAVEVQCHTAGVLDFLQEQHNKLHTSSGSAEAPPVTFDLTTEPDVVPIAEPAPALPVVLVDLVDDTDFMVAEKPVEVKVERKKRSNRTSYKLPVHSTTALQNDTLDGEADVKVEKKKGGAKKKRDAEVGGGAVGAVGVVGIVGIVGMEARGRKRALREDLVRQRWKTKARRTRSGRC